MLRFNPNFLFPQLFSFNPNNNSVKTSYDKKIHGGNILTLLLFVGEAELVARMDRKSTDANCILDFMVSMFANTLDLRFSPFTRLHHLRFVKRCKRLSPKRFTSLEFLPRSLQLNQADELRETNFFCQSREVHCLSISVGLGRILGVVS